MANKRMFSKAIVDSDAFLDMPMSAQALYFHLGMNADDDGFVGNPRRIQRVIGANEDDLKVLIGKKFLLAFESGVVVIKHHRINNKWDAHNCRRTSYTKELGMLHVKENKAYTNDISQGTPVISTYRLNSDCKQSLEENRIEKNKVKESSSSKATKVNFEPVDMKLAEYLQACIANNFATWRPPKSLDKWAEDIGRLRRLDKRTEQEIAGVIKWAQNNAFWRKNILSGAKLRKQFDRLYIEAESEHNNNAGKVAF